jgi:hypothetical protein
MAWRSVFAANARVLGLAVLALAPVAGASVAAAPELTLLTPANGATVVHSGALATPPTLGWRIDWRDAPAAGSVLVVVRVGTDAPLTQNVSENTFACTVRSASCRTSFKPNRVHAGTNYWRVRLAGSVRATSETWSFVSVRQGSTPTGPDRVKPRVRALPGVAQRGQTAFFAARVADDRRVARLRAALLRRGHEVVRAAATFRTVAWARAQTLYTNRPLSRGLAAGAYRLCVTAWDRAGNNGRSCAAYRVR